MKNTLKVTTPTEREAVMTRRSSSQTVMAQPGGPNSQRRSSSGLEKASQTIRRGAAKTRVTTISRSVGVVTFMTFFIGAVLSRCVGCMSRIRVASIGPASVPRQSRFERLLFLVRAFISSSRSSRRSKFPSQIRR